MQVREKYERPEADEFIVVQRAFLNVQMSAEMPEGIDNEDGTFGTATIIEDN